MIYFLQLLDENQDKCHQGEMTYQAIVQSPNSSNDKVTRVTSGRSNFITFA